MQIVVTTRHGELSEANREFIHRKVEKLNRFFERLTAIEVIVDLKEAGRPRIDIKASAEHKHDFVAHDQLDSLMSTVEAAVQKMEQQLRKYKEKVQERGRGVDFGSVPAPAAGLGADGLGADGLGPDEQGAADDGDSPAT